MALTQINANAIEDGAITADIIDASVSLSGPRIANVQIANSSWSVLDDTAIDVDGGYIVINGVGFADNCTVLFDGTPASAVTYIDASTLRVQVPALAANTYNVYVNNPDGGVAIGVSQLTSSALPTWVTGSSLEQQVVDAPISIQLDATDAIYYTLQDGSVLPANVSLAANGLITGVVSGIVSDTTYNFTVVATDAENQDSPRTFALNVTTVIARAFNISPSVGGVSSWDLDVSGPLTLPSGTYTITPTGRFTANVAMWGGGGGGKDSQYDSSSNYGGNGGSSFATITFENNTDYIFVSAAGPTNRSGNYSGIFNTGISQSNAILMAGGGGGGGYSTAGNHGQGGSGGGETGVNGDYLGAATAGTQVGGGSGGSYVAYSGRTGTNGNPGTALTGGAGVGQYGAGAGGSGYWGGGSAAYSEGFDAVGGGGGGSGFVKSGISGNTHQGIVELSTYRGSTAGVYNNGGLVVLI